MPDHIPDATNYLRAYQGMMRGDPKPLPYRPSKRKHRRRFTTDDPTLGMADRQPPILAGVARSIGASGK